MTGALRRTLSLANNIQLRTMKSDCC